MALGTTADEGEGGGPRGAVNLQSLNRSSTATKMLLKLQERMVDSLVYVNASAALKACAILLSISLAVNLQHKSPLSFAVAYLLPSLLESMMSLADMMILAAATQSEGENRRRYVKIV